MILVRNIRLSLSAKENAACEAACRELKLSAAQVQECHMAKLSVDARHGKPSLVCTVAISLKEPGQEAAAAARRLQKSRNF